MKKFDLLTWCQQYIRSRDAMERKLVSLEEKDGGLVAVYKDRTVQWLPQSELQLLKENSGHITIVCLQTQQNFNTLVQQFSWFSMNPNLTILFLNPQANEKWVLKPAVHAAVADKSTLKTGLQTLFQTVPII
jgi:hypothetical protein